MPDEHEHEHDGLAHCDRWVRETLAGHGVPADRLTAADVEDLLGHVGRLVAALVRLRRDRSGPWDADLAEVRRADTAIRALARELAGDAPGDQSSRDRPRR